MTQEAALRVAAVDDVLHVAAADVAALLLDLAQTADQHPELTAASMLREVARGLAAYEPGERP
jgi:hypothetical protein